VTPPATTAPAPPAPADPQPPPAEPPETGTLTPGGQLPPAASAAEALDRASAAYEFGELEMMITLARMVAEGAVPGDDDQRAEALRLLGIGLYVQGRQDGAARAFLDLIRLRPATNLDPSSTRPEVVAFFRDVRRRNQPKRYMALAFLPPLGQFQNDTPVRGWLFGALEATTFGAALTTRLVLADWVDANKACKGGSDPSPCNRMKLYNAISVHQRRRPGRHLDHRRHRRPRRPPLRAPRPVHPPARLGQPRLPRHPPHRRRPPRFVLTLHRLKYPFHPGG
jgi:hypothetical protein